ncbi:MAG: Ig-like domain-containing protein [Caldilineaceae bacterium]
MGGVAGPTLEVADATLNADSGSISVPVLFNSNGASIAGVAFSIDYQESCLSYDSFSGAPAGFTPNVTNDPLDTDGELDISLIDDSTPIDALSDGTLLTVVFNVLPACVTTNGATTNVVVNFSNDPAPSFGGQGAGDVESTNPATGGTLTLEFNATPTDITLAPSSVNENEASGATVGTLTTTDPDAGDTHTYTLMAGTGDADNGSFTIVGDQLQTAASFNFEVKNSYSIRVQTDDSKPNGTFAKELTITINDVNDAPVAVDDPDDLRTTVVVGAASINVDVLANDSDEDGDTLTVASIIQPAAGSTTNNSTNIAFTGPNANGTTTFTYQATDGTANSADATVTVNYVKDDLRGDCNGSGSVTAADFVGVVLELFDAGDDPQYQSNPAWWLIYDPAGYAGGPVGCDANASQNGAGNDTDSVTAADIICTVRVFFGDTSCAIPPVMAAGVQSSSTATLQAANVAASTGATADAPIMLQSNGNVAAAFTIRYDASNLRFDASDADGDGLPDALALHLPTGVQPWTQVRDGEIQVALAGLQLPLSALADGALATATFDVTGSGSAVRLTNVSLGDTNGADLAVTTNEV